MKSTRFSLCAVLLCLLSTFLQAQPYFFEHTYGTNVSNTSNQDFGYDGHRRHQNSEGYMVSGASRGVPTDLKIAFAVTYGDGNISASDFENYYVAQDAGGVQLRVPYSFCGEVNGRDFGLAGVCGVTPGFARSIYYAQISNTGAVIASRSYNLGSNFGSYTLREMVTEPTKKFVYIMGEVSQFTPSRNLIYVMKLKYDGTIQWSQVYDLETSSATWDFAFDGVELPGADEFALVGWTADLTGNHFSGYIFRLDANTGLPSFPRIMLLDNPNDEFVATCVDWSEDTGISSRTGGFIVGGIAGGPGANEAAAILVDNDFVNPWAVGNVYTTSISNGTSYVLDVASRYSPSGVYEYYLTGGTDAPYYGSKDIETWRLDDAISGLSGNTQYAFGTTGYDESRAIDLTWAGADGMAIFGTTDATNGRNDLLILNAYLNGVLPSGCNWQTNIPITNTPLSVSQISAPNPLYNISYFTDEIALYGPILDNQICGAPDVGGGDNTKTGAPKIMTANILRLIGNPDDGYTIQIEQAAKGTEPLHVSLCDMTGRVLYATQFQVQQGENEFKLNLADAQFAAGVYTVRWTSSRYIGAEKIMLK